MDMILYHRQSTQQPVGCTAPEHVTGSTFSTLDLEILNFDYFYFLIHFCFLLSSSLSLLILLQHFKLIPLFLQFWLGREHL